MVAATELITDSVEENTQALNLLAEVVDKLQGLIVASKHPKSSPPHRPRQRTPPPPPPRVSSISPKVVRKPPTPYPRHLSSSSSSRSSSSSSSSSPSSCADGFPPSRSPKRLNGGSKRSTVTFGATHRAGGGGGGGNGQISNGSASRTPLGATIRRDEDTGGIYIARVIHGGLADRSGLLHPGDLVVEVNGHPVGGLDPEQVIQMLIHSQGTILFKVIPKAAQSSSSQKPVYMRAMVDYFPQQDSSIPCPDAGMAFSRGDLLEVVDQSDGQWWQARKLPCAVSCAGLIPSASMLKRKRRQSCTSCSPSSSTLSSPYEEVALYQRPPAGEPPPHHPRASGVGVSELRKRLIKLNPSTFQGPVPHTTRPMGAGEQTGREYHFVTKELFEYMVCNHRFVEYGEYRGHLYGTSTDAIDDVLKRGRMCVIDVEPHSIQPLRTRKLKPYVIFIKAPGPERLRQTRRHARLITNCSVNRAFTEDDFVELEEASRLMEAKYKHFFDCVLVNDDLQDACMQLCSVIQQAQEEPQWIPVSWGRPEE
uniref:Membrane protein, palmitoylated 4a (MAGUK p55 subfamily member 4) n=1 Tax=Scophthalmus maximus TaxID=52904 RepID=A0A8D3C1N6_SCOMX